MRNAMILLALTLAAPQLGCKKKNEDAGTGSAVASGSAPAPDKGSGSAAANNGSGSGSTVAASGSGSQTPTIPDKGSGAGSGSGSDAGTPMAHHAGMCPSTVFGSITKVDAKGGKVTVTISSEDKDAIVAIQKRAETSLKEKMGASGQGTGSGHDMKGTHGGGMGMCPIHVPEGVKAESKNDAKGVVVTLTPKDAKDADALKTDIEGRIVKARDWVDKNIKPADKGNQGGDGGGSGNDGMNRSGSGDGKGLERKAGKK